MGPPSASEYFDFDVAHFRRAQTANSHAIFIRITKNYHTYPEHTFCLILRSFPPQMPAYSFGNMDMAQLLGQNTFLALFRMSSRFFLLSRSLLFITRLFAPWSLNRRCKHPYSMQLCKRYYMYIHGPKRKRQKHIFGFFFRI